MKNTVLNQYTFHQPMYPGAADARYFTRKALEILIAILSGTGALTFMVFLMAIC